MHVVSYYYTEMAKLLTPSSRLLSEFRELAVLRWVGRPVCLDRHEDLLRVEGPVLMVQDAALPPHPLAYGQDLGEDVDRVADDGRALRPQYPIHLQEDVGYVAPAKFTKCALFSVCLVLCLLLSQFSHQGFHSC